MEYFSTDGLPADQKAAAWSEMVGNDFARGDISPRHPADFDGSLKRISLGPMVLSEIRCSAVKVRYAPDAAQMSHASYLLFMPQDRGFELSLNGRSGLWVNKGELCLVDLARPHELMQHESAQSFFLRFPRRHLERLLPRAAHFTGQVITPDLAAARILQSFLRELVREISQSNAAKLPYFVCPSMLNLIAGVYAAHTDEPVDPDIRTRARAFRNFIDRDLTNPNLRQTDVACQFGVSDRYVRAALREAGISFSRYVLDQRLKKSRQLLRDPELRSITITEISFRAGFNSASHFGRAFKERYGLSPRVFRLGH